MTPNEYQAFATKTVCDQDRAAKRMTMFPNGYNILPTHLAHAILGLTGEAGELAAAFEKWIYYNKPLDTANIMEELGDCLWYLAEACTSIGIDLETVMMKNIAKLKARYPNLYNDKDAAEENRDREKERRAMDQIGGE